MCEHCGVPNCIHRQIHLLSAERVAFDNLWDKEEEASAAAITLYQRARDRIPFGTPMYIYLLKAEHAP